MNSTAIISALVAVITALAGVIRYLYLQSERKDQQIVAFAERSNENLKEYVAILAKLLAAQKGFGDGETVTGSSRNPGDRERNLSA